MRNPDSLTTRPNDDTPTGLAFAIAAYVFWGFLPLYMKALSHIPAAEVVAHRVVWSLTIASLVLVVMRRTQDLKAALLSPRTLLMRLITATLISINWGIYLWAITSGHALDAALGYYINPLFSILLGALLLSERMSKRQLLAVGLAVGDVLVLALDTGSILWVILGLTLSWGFYTLAGFVDGVYAVGRGIHAINKARPCKECDAATRIA